MPSGTARSDRWSASDYEQQRKDLLHKYGIDLQDGETTGLGTKRMSRKQVAELMGPSVGSRDGKVFTWREKNRRKVSGPLMQRI